MKHTPKQMGPYAIKSAIKQAKMSKHLIAAAPEMFEALLLAPVYVTPDGVWWNFRPDPKTKMGAAMIQVYGPEAAVLRNWHERVSAALAKARGES